MGYTDHQSNYYLTLAMEAMERAYDCNRDTAAGPHISRAISALHTLMVATSPWPAGHGESDPHEINEFNSAI